MESFQDSARRNNVWSTLVVGATFGVFLTFGNAWSEFIKVSIESIVPQQEQHVLSSFVYATSASIFCLFILFVLIRIDMCVQAANSRRHKMKFNSRLSNIHIRSRTDVSLGK